MRSATSIEEESKQLRNTSYAIVITTIFMVLWNIFYDAPLTQKRQQYEKQQQNKAKKDAGANVKSEEIDASDKSDAIFASTNYGMMQIVKDEDTEVVASLENRVMIQNENVRASINLIGAKLDDLALLNYRDKVGREGINLRLLSPQNTRKPYFITFGWLSGSENVDLPNSKTIWTSNKESASVGEEVELKYVNSVGITFKYYISLDEKFMFKVRQSVENGSQSSVSFSNFAAISRHYGGRTKDSMISFEGPIVNADNIINEYKYEDISKNEERISNKSISFAGFDEKYWLTSLIPTVKSKDLELKIRYKEGKALDDSGKTVKMPRHQIDYVSSSYLLEPNKKSTFDNLIFVGAKEIETLEKYSKQYKIQAFDKTIDFGWYYFITKPMFLTLKWLNKVFGSFAVAIIALTVLVKLLTLPLATKSYTSMHKMKLLAPRMKQIKEECGQDRKAAGMKIVEMYRKEKVNPMSGFLILLLQVPIFFSLYKVFVVSIEMRHAKFLWFIKDLSAPDPTSIFNLFGILPYSVPSFLAIGVLPVVMGITMVIQQKLSPPATDETYQKVASAMPYVFTVIFASFSSGLILYWIVNNILSIIQQKYIAYKFSHLAAPATGQQPAQQLVGLKKEPSLPKPKSGGKKKTKKQTSK